MIQSLYSAATGMQAQQLNLNTIANNLANANTTGYKKDKIEFQDLLYQNPKIAGAQAGSESTLTPTGVEVGGGTRVVSTAKVFTQGTLTQTGGQFDLAISGDGFLAVQRPDGTIGYTRDGSLHVDGTGHVTTSDGMPVLSNFQAIPTGTNSVSVSSTGNVSLTGANGTTNFAIQLTRLANPSGLQNLGGNLAAETPASGAPETGAPGANGFGTISQGYLESSNVNIVEEMVNMITAQRAYEINSKSIQTSDEMLGQIQQLKK